MGYAPQLGVPAAVKSAALASALGKGTVSIDFPDRVGARTLHWGLMSQVAPDVEVLVEAAQVQKCLPSADLACASPDPAPQTNVPLAVWLKLFEPVVDFYTVSHNISPVKEFFAKWYKKSESRRHQDWRHRSRQNAAGGSPAGFDRVLGIDRHRIVALPYDGAGQE